ncbi:MAG: hypothetical protein WDZ84_10500 [Rhodovibrionaceae bacterium]
MTRTAKAAIAAAILVSMGLSLSACDEDEQDRILRYDKGTYLGEPDDPLDQGTLDELRNRARNQQGA